VRLSRFISVILAPTFLLLRSRQTTPPDGVFDPNRFFRDTRIPTEQALKVLAHQTHPGSAGHSAHSASTYWAFEDLRAKPYLRASSNLLVPNALSFAFQRATTGIFWMLHSDNLGHVHDFTGHFGKMFEDYCLRLVESIERREVLRVTGPVVYRRGGNTVESSDIIVSALGSYRAIRIFVECGAIRPSLSVLRDGDLSEFRKYVDRIVGKLTQLHERIEDHRAGLFELGDELPSGALYCPVLVIDEPFYWSKELRDILDEKVRKRNLLSGFDTTKLIICDVKDLEYLIEQTEKGNGLPDMLLAYLKEGRSAGMRQFLQERDPSLDAPSLVNAGFGDLMNMVARECYDRDLDNAL
jgi:hypothetical protein